MKQCQRCKEYKDEAEFGWKNRLLGIRLHICKECKHKYDNEWYESHQEEQRQRIKSRREKMKDEAEKFVYDYLSNQRCVDCGEYDFSVLTFDHVRGKKKMDVATMVANGYSIDAIREEILKCEVVCSNCHMRREQKRKGHDRFEKFWPKFPEDYEKWKDEDEDYHL